MIPVEERAELQRFRAAMDLVDDAITLVDRATMRFIDVNRTACDQTGYTREEFLRMGPHDLSTLTREEHERIYDELIVGAQAPARLIGMRRNKDGSTVPIEIYRSVVRSAGSPVIVAVVRDISQSVRVDKLQNLQYAVARCLSEAEDASTALQCMMRAVCETEDWECGRYFRLDEGAGVLRFGDAWHVPGEAFERFIERSRSTTYEKGVGLVGTSWQSGQPLWSADINNDPRAYRKSHSFDMGVRAVFLFPVTAQGRTLGVLVFSTRQTREPDSRLLGAVHAIGSQIGQFLQRKQAEEKMRNQALQQRLIAEFGQQAFASADLDAVLRRAAVLVAETLGADYCSVLELIPAGTHLVYRAVTGWPQDWIGNRMIPTESGGRLAHVLAHREPLVTVDYSADSRFSTSLAVQYGVHSSAQVPILGTSSTFGVLSAYTLQTRHFREEEVSFLRSIANILAIAIERRSAEDKLARLAQFDTVTGLPNRHLFRDRLGQSLTQAQRNGWLGGVLLVGLDRFKAVNDTLGHAVGDKLLGRVAGRLKGCVRAGDTVARLDGDEFAIVLSSLAKSDDAGLVAQKIITALEAPFDLVDHKTYISASVGIALYPGDGDETEMLIRNADTAMYRAREQGHGSYQFYLPQMNEQLMQRLHLEENLRGALERGEFRIHYQPKVRLDTGTITGFEALLRWQHGDRLISPAEFIPILEETGLIVQVGEWVLRAVCERIGQWKAQGIAPRPVAVNLSTRQFQHKFLVTMVERTLRETGVEPGLIELELTESLLMSDAQEAVQMLRELKGLGVRLAVDDFGTGYSSLAYLKRFPLDTLKIDRAFIRDAVNSADDGTLTVTIINLAHSMRLRVVAEGVETEAQLNFLRTHGCDEMQGYYFARPLEAAECTRALVEDRRLKNQPSPAIRNLPTLLLVDDDDADLELLKHALASDDFRILTANSAAAGLETLASNGAAVVVSDYQMPGMSGVEFLSHVRRLYPNAVRVVSTGCDDPFALVGAVNEAGIHKFLSKSWNADRVRAEVRAAYRQRTAEAASPSAG